MSENPAKLRDANFTTGAVRSADVDGLDFAALPLLGLLGVVAVAGAGGIKYGRFNYMLGMPVHVTLNHVAVHLIRYLLGDRSEDHLSKIAWGAMVANQTALTNPEQAEPYLLGTGAEMTAALLAELERGKPERDARRQAGEFEGLFAGTLADLPEVQEIVRQRYEARAGQPIRDVEHAGFDCTPAASAAPAAAPCDHHYNTEARMCLRCGATRAAVLDDRRAADAARLREAVDDWKRAGPPVNPNAVIPIKTGYDPAARTVDGVPVVEQLGRRPAPLPFVDGRR